MMTVSSGAKKEVIDPETKLAIQSLAKEEFCLRCSSHPVRLPESDPATDAPLTPESTPPESHRSHGLGEDKPLTAVSKPAEECQIPDGSIIAAASDESVAAETSDTTPTSLRRSKRNASTRATSAMRAISASMVNLAELIKEEENIGQEPPTKKAKLTLHCQPRISDRVPRRNPRNDRIADSQLDTSSILKRYPVTPASVRERGSGLQSSAVNRKGQLAPSISNISSTGSPRKRAAPRNAKVKTVITHQAPVDVRPQPYGQPLVWAEQRQALCETLPYYRAFQSGAYTNDGLGYGFLLDKDCGERAYMDEEVVITRAGGGCKANENGMMEQADDQCGTSLKIISFINNKEQCVPVGLIVGAKNENCPSKIPHRYCVMDFFQVTEIWAEKSNRKTCFKFRFEKIDLASKSWWAPAGSPLPVRSSAMALREACMRCKKSSPEVFQNGWMCLNDACSRFWKLNGRDPPARLEYNPVFLQERTSWPSHIKPPFPLRPDILVVDNKTDVNLAVSRASWKGMACPKCGRCNSRTLWNAWKCQTVGCGFTHGIKHTIIDPHTVLPDHGADFTGHALPQDKYSDPLTMRDPEYIGDWRIHTYDLLPGNCIAHFMANSTLNNKPGGAHDMFRALQGADMKLQRFPLDMSATEGEILIKHFAVNYGMPYKYVVSVDSKSFSEAPKPVMNALNRLTWAARRCVSDGSFVDFNEELVLGYFEKQAIGYHDDGERDLGPTIATLSLGGDAVMTIRLKKRYYEFPKGLTLETYDPLARVIPGSRQYKERLVLNNLYRAGNMKGFKIAKAELFRKPKNNVKNAAPILTMKLRMGDMVVMHGAEMQKYFEHSVVPEGKLRFALTCRYVNPARIPETEHWKGKFSFDPAELYTGDVDLAADDADFSFLENGDAEMNTASHSGNTAVDNDSDMIESSTVVISDVESLTTKIPVVATLSDNENHLMLTPTTTVSPAVSSNSDGQSQKPAVLNAPIWF